MVADIAAQFGGYWGDMTRCAHAGPPSDWAAQAWDVVKEAYDDAVAATKLGNTARDVDAAQRVIIEAHADLGACLHGAGHAIGTEVHEPPFLIATSDAPLREGMIFTVEPGIYDSERGGIRLEDDMLVGADGPVKLSALPAGATHPRVSGGTASRRLKLARARRCHRPRIDHGWPARTGLCLVLDRNCRCPCKPAPRARAATHRRLASPLSSVLAVQNTEPSRSSTAPREITPALHANYRLTTL